MNLTKLALVLPLGAMAYLFAQGLDTPASKDDWEEINFDFDSSVLVDGFPSLLRLAELLDQNPGYKVRIEGHTDGLGSDAYNQRLGLARANTVRDFLIKYHARPNQIETVSRGKSDPRASKQGTSYSRTDPARFMNRRVVLTVTDEQGRTVSAGGAGDAIRAIQAQQAKDAKAAADCCNEVLKRLDKLDEIAKMLRDLADQNAALRKEVADLKTAQQGLQQSQNDLQNRVNQAGQSAQAAQNAVSQLPSSAAIANAAADELQRRNPRFQLLGLNIGSDSNGDVTFTGRGQYFAPFGSRFGFQAQAEYLYFKSSQEGQFDIGLVDRLTRRLQAGLFSSFRHVTLSDAASGGTLGQGALTLDYIFSRGTVGIFGTKGFLNNPVIGQTNVVTRDGTVLNNIFLERYLHIVDQAGVNASIGIYKNIYAEGNAGYLKSIGYGDRFGGTVRLVFPLNSKIALTAEGDVNPTMLSRDNYGRAVFGVIFGNFMRPKELLPAGHAIPAQVPRVRYEVLTRTVRTGNNPPVADAGPDRDGVTAGVITLDGSNSYDPDGDPITYQWTQESGPQVTLTSPTAAKTNFNAVAGQTYSFRLTVKDSYGAQNAARVRIGTRGADRVQIVFFVANPTSVQPGASSTLSWRVLNADTVTISGIGNVASTGTAPVAPSQTTTYSLTAKNAISEETATAAVVVSAPTAKLLYCYAQPATIQPGEAATLNWSAPNADSVTITPNVGTVAKTGSFTVTPTETTAYVITATSGNNAASDSCGVVVTVGSGGPPRIINFLANPATINSGEKSNLSWQVENADTVTISILGTVQQSGSREVAPTQSTTYTLVATNRFGSAQATTNVNVNTVAPVKIISFTANPPASPGPGTKVELTCQTQGATSVLINGILFLPGSAVAVVFPNQTTTYTCVATGPTGQTDTQNLTVTVNTGSGGNPTPGPTIVVAGGLVQETIYRDFVLDASASFSSTNPGPLKFHWTSHDSGAAILDPDSPTPHVQLYNSLGIYLFDVTVTDSKGHSTTATVSVKLVFRP